MGKAHAHAYLATKPHPDCHVGIGALRHYWPLASSAFLPLKEFIRGLFVT